MFLLGLAPYGVALGLVDASTNMQAVAIEHALGRPVLPSMHGAWTFGGILGAGLTLATPGVPVTALGVVGAGAAAWRSRRRTCVVSGSPRASHDVAVPWRPIVMVGLAMVLFYMVDTAAATWGPTYLDRAFPTPSSLARARDLPLPRRVAGGRGWPATAWSPPRRRSASCGPAPSCRLRRSCSSSLRRRGRSRSLGFTLLGLGVAVIAPLAFSAAARIAGDGVDGPARCGRPGSTWSSAGSTSSTTSAGCSAPCSPASWAPTTCGSASPSRWC